MKREEREVVKSFKFEIIQKGIKGFYEWILMRKGLHKAFYSQQETREKS